MGGFYQPQPNSESLGYATTEFDSLSDEELDKLINATGKARVATAQKPKPYKIVDLDAIARQING